ALLLDQARRHRSRARDRVRDRRGPQRVYPRAGQPPARQPFRPRVSGPPARGAARRPRPARGVRRRVASGGGEGCPRRSWWWTTRRTSGTRCAACSPTRASRCSRASTAAPAAAGPAPSRAPARRFPERTIGRSVLVNGQGLHSGARTGLILQPLPPGSGIVFGSILSGESVPALVDHIDSTGYATTLVRGGMVAKTVEHLMATLHGYGVTNLLVKMQAEVPILDGSALELCALLDESGLVDQPATVEELVIDQRNAVGSDDPAHKGIAIEPADLFEVHYVLDYPPP